MFVTGATAIHRYVMMRDRRRAASPHVQAIAALRLSYIRGRNHGWNLSPSASPTSVVYWFAASPHVRRRHGGRISDLRCLASATSAATGGENWDKLTRTGVRRNPAPTTPCSAPTTTASTWQYVPFPHGRLPDLVLSHRFPIIPTPCSIRNPGPSAFQTPAPFGLICKRFWILGFRGNALPHRGSAHTNIIVRPCATTVPSGPALRWTACTAAFDGGYNWTCHAQGRPRPLPGWCDMTTTMALISPARKPPSIAPCPSGRSAVMQLTCASAVERNLVPPHFDPHGRKRRSKLPGSH